MFRNLIAVLILCLTVCACSRIEILREYDETGIVRERGSAWGLMDKQTARFQMRRYDQRAAGDLIEETAGAEAQWTHDPARKVLQDLIAAGLAAYLAGHGVPAMPNTGGE